MGNGRPDRILTPEQRELHILAVQRKYDGTWPKPGEDAELLGDLATEGSNMFHCPETGHKCWYPDTPAWVIEMAIRRKWWTKHNGNWGFLQEKCGKCALPAGA